MILKKVFSSYTRVFPKIRVLTLEEEQEPFLKVNELYRGYNNGYNAPHVLSALDYQRLVKLFGHNKVIGLGVYKDEDTITITIE